MQLCTLHGARWKYPVNCCVVLLVLLLGSKTRQKVRPAFHLNPSSVFPTLFPPTIPALIRFLTMRLFRLEQFAALSAWFLKTRTVFMLSHSMWVSLGVGCNWNICIFIFAFVFLRLPLGNDSLYVVKKGNKETFRKGPQELLPSSGQGW